MAKSVTKKKLEKRIKALEKTVKKQNRQIKLLAVTAFDSPRKSFFAEADNLVTVPVYPDLGEVGEGLGPCARVCEDNRRTAHKAAAAERDPAVARRLAIKAEEDYAACIGFNCFDIKPSFKA